MLTAVNDIAGNHKYGGQYQVRYSELEVGIDEFSVAYGVIANAHAGAVSERDQGHACEDQQGCRVDFVCCPLLRVVDDSSGDRDDLDRADEQGVEHCIAHDNS